MKILLILFLALSLNANSLVKELENLSPAQKEVFEKTKRIGELNDLTYSLLAIAWQESNFGQELIGRWSPDYGVFQINIKSFKRRYKDTVEEYSVTDEEIKYILINDFKVNIISAIRELRFWNKVHGNNWNKVWASYNDGTHISSKGERYSSAILAKVRALKIYLNK